MPSSDFEDVDSHEQDVDSEEEEITIKSDQVVDKYKKASDVANSAIAKVIKEIKVGASTLDLCKLGDQAVRDETAKLYKNKKNKKMKKGLAWPTCISVNNIICHYSPLESYPNVMVLAEDDLVKVEIGSHIDGFPAFVAHSVVVGACAEKKVTGRKADVMWAAYNAAEVAVRMLKPGTTNHEITEAIRITTKCYDCKPIQNMASYNIEKDIVEGEKSILQNPVDHLSQRLQREGNKDENPSGNKQVNPALMGEKQDIEVGDVWAIDVLASTGDGRVATTEVKTSLYRRNPDQDIFLANTKSAREVLSQVDKNHGFMTFSLRDFDSEVKTRLGLKTPVDKEAITQYAVMQEKKEELVAQFKYTVLVINPTSIRKVTGLDFEKDLYVTEKEIDDKDIKNLLATSTSRKANKKKKNKSKKKGAQDLLAHLGKEEKPTEANAQPAN